MKIAVSGASGLIGSALVPTLETADHEAVRIVRREPPTANEVGWDPDAGTIDAAGLGGIDAIVSPRGESLEKRWTEERNAEVLQSRVTTAGLLGRTAAELDPRPSVLASAGGAGINGGGEIGVAIERAVAR